MRIVGIDIAEREETHVHTIDMWFSTRRNQWCVERLNSGGDVIGAIYHSPNEHDARACLEDWLRAHGETHLVTPPETRSKAKRVARPASREPRRAA